MKKTIAILVLAFCAGLAWRAKGTDQAQLDRIQTLAAENERLRLFNAREVRRHRIHAGIVKPEISGEALAMAQHLTGCAPEAIRGVYMAEDGPPDIETGVLGKTDFYAAHLPLKDWPAVEAGRTLNIYTWRWLTGTPQGRKALREILAAAAGPYTQVSPARQKQWVATIMREIETPAATPTPRPTPTKPKPRRKS